MFDKIDVWLSSLHEEDVLVQIKELETRASELLAEIDKLANERERVEVDLAKANEILAMKRRWQKPAPSSSTHGAAPRRGREAVRAIINEDPTRQWRPPDVLDALIERGWADEDDLHSVQVSLSRMFRNEELERPRRGVYRLPRVAAHGVGGSLALPLQIEDAEDAPKNEASANVGVQS
jgi:hypothetical protein